MTSDDPARLSEIGIRHVVNLALENHPEALADEQKLLADQGIAYTHIPVPFDAPNSSHLQALREVLNNTEEPIHVHCIMNYRVTAFFYLLDCASGVPEQEALAAMTAVWNPLDSDHPTARPWREFLKAERNRFAS